MFTSWTRNCKDLLKLCTRTANYSGPKKQSIVKEMEWFINAAKPFAGMEINIVSETITTHEYESKVLAPAFTAITGIKVTHDLIGEGDVVEKLQTQMQSGQNIYDAYINDSDLIGTHWRYQQARNLTDWMEGEGADVTNPGLDLDDFIGTNNPAPVAHNISHCEWEAESSTLLRFEIESEKTRYQGTDKERKTITSRVYLRN